MGKVKKVYKHKKIVSVGAAIKMGLKPYIDFYPIKKLTKIKPSTKTLAEMMQEDSPLKSWADLGNCAKDLYDTPGEALDVLARESIKVKKDKRDPRTYLLCLMLENEKQKKINKGKKFNKIIDEVLEQCCTYIDVDYDTVDIPKTEMVVGHRNKRVKYSRQKIIDRVVSKHDRLVIKQPSEYKDWVKNESHTVLKLLK
tara:strand:- start:1366 stop:1959 length:594 start_codon:yes stop_codon:yes gene_type:complete